MSTGPLVELLERCRRSVTDCDAAAKPLEEQCVVLARRPPPRLHALIEKLQAKQNGEADIDEKDIRRALAQGQSLANATGKLRCSRCNAITDAACDCGVLYVRAGLRFFANLSNEINTIKSSAGSRNLVTKRAPGGRPPIGERAMTVAERQRRSRAKRREHR